MKPQLALIGGLLGSGKTTLLRSFAAHLNTHGRRVALITNDQTGGLVDTIYLEKAGLSVEEVVGACFCCDFDGLTQAILNSLAHSPDVILAEPVGSCTDLQSTVVAPLKDLLADSVSVLPLTVLVDPHRINEMNALSLNDAGGEAVKYLFTKQLEEADLIALTKIDTLDDALREDAIRQLAVQVPVVSLSAVTEEGIVQWWDALQRLQAGDARLKEIDYGVYAEAEAAMGWLNMKLSVSPETVPDLALAGFLKGVVNDIETRRGHTGNFKCVLVGDNGYLRGGLLRSTESPSIEGRLSLRSGNEKAEFTVNLRATLDATELKETVLRHLTDWNAEVLSVDALHPAPPRPTHRYAPLP